MTLRTRVLVALAIVAVGLIGAAVLMTRTTESNLVEQVDDQLHKTARSSDSVFMGGPHRGPEDVPFSTFYVYAVSSSGEEALLSVPGAQGSDPSKPDISAEEVLERAGGDPFTVSSTDGDTRYRALVYPYRGDVGVVGVFAAPLDDVDATMSQFVLIEVIVTASILGLLALVGWWVVRLGVRPVKQIADAAASIGAGNLSRRVPDAADGTEAAELGAALNQMLEQIEDAFEKRASSEERLRQFVADASHELRTPLATVRGYTELYRSGGLRNTEQLDDAMRRSEQETIRMGRLVDDLLLLAALDRGRPLDRSPVSVGELVSDVVSEALVRHPDRTVTVEIDGRFNVIGDEERLKQALTNLVSNAIVHTPDGTDVAVTVVAEDDHVLITVTDDGPGLEPDVAARIFERFFRADKARSRAAGGTGLGLSIVHAIVTAHGGTVDVDSEPGRGTTFVVRLPRSLPAPAPAPAPDSPAPAGGSAALTSE